MGPRRAITVLFWATVIDFHALLTFRDALEALEQFGLVIGEPDADLLGPSRVYRILSLARITVICRLRIVLLRLGVGDSLEGLSRDYVGQTLLHLRVTLLSAQLNEADRYLLLLQVCASVKIVSPSEKNGNRLEASIDFAERGVRASGRIISLDWLVTAVFFLQEEKDLLINELEIYTLSHGRMQISVHDLGFKAV